MERFFSNWKKIILFACLHSLGLIVLSLFLQKLPGMIKGEDKLIQSAIILKRIILEHDAPSEKFVFINTSFSNQLISRDEKLHTDFAVLLYTKYLENKLSTKEVHDMFKEAVAIEIEFVTESLPCNLIGMNKELMKEYIKFVADFLLTQLGEPKIWSVSNPFPFMEQISMEGKTNFFEGRVAEYSKSGLNVKKEDMVFSLDADF